MDAFAQVEMRVNPFGTLHVLEVVPHMRQDSRCCQNVHADSHHLKNLPMTSAPKYKLTRCLLGQFSEYL